MKPEYHFHLYNDGSNGWVAQLYWQAGLRVIERAIGEFPADFGASVFLSLIQDAEAMHAEGTKYDL